MQSVGLTAMHTDNVLFAMQKICEMENLGYMERLLMKSIELERLRFL
jgi:hypothetical protein